LITELNNPSSEAALLVRVKAVREGSNDPILPAIYSDNYIALMAGEQRTIRTELEDAHRRGERPRIVIEGFNLADVAEKSPAPRTR
jgi:Exo-beta-D-glucosaminidase Ig-fold domain